MELTEEFALFQKLGPQDYFREKNLARYQEFQMNIELSYRLIENQTTYPKITDKEKQELQVEIARPELLEQSIKDRYTAWIIQTGFFELHKWVKDILVDFHLIRKLHEIEVNYETFVKHRIEISGDTIAGKDKGLIFKTRGVMGDLSELDTYDKINSLRNCLEHQNGILTEYYCKPNTYMDISGERIIIYWDEPSGKRLVGLCNNKSSSSLKISKEPYTLRYNALEKINISLKEFSWLKDSGLFLFLKLADHLFGPDDRPIISMKIKHRTRTQ
jgi:hypothetical protein